MPVLPDSSFKPPKALRNRHFHTILANAFRKVNGIQYRRERITTPDDDFLDLDWSEIGSDTLVIVTHGLEGNSSRPYVMGMVRTANTMGWDAVAWNFRSCSGEINRQKIFYHGGVTWDLETVIHHTMETKKYNRVFLVSFSLGGNITLKYLGEKGHKLPEKLERAVVISVPVWLEDSVISLEKGTNRMYEQMFLLDYKRKLKEKAEAMPGVFDLTGLDKIFSLRQFDNQYVGPVHGFRDGMHMYEETSSRPFIRGIQIPTLIINAKDDPFLGSRSYPIEEAHANDQVFLEMPEQGGHVGFFTPDGYWTEQRVAEWLAPDWFDFPRSLGIG